MKRGVLTHWSAWMWPLILLADSRGAPAREPPARVERPRPEVAEPARPDSLPKSCVWNPRPPIALGVPASDNPLLGKSLREIAARAALQWKAFAASRAHDRTNAWDERFYRRSFNHLLAAAGIEEAEAENGAPFSSAITDVSPLMTAWPPEGTCWLYEQPFQCASLRDPPLFAAFPFFAFNHETYASALERFDRATSSFRAIDADDPRKAAAELGKGRALQSLPIGYEDLVNPWPDTLPYDPAFSWNYISGGYGTLLAPASKVRDAGLIRGKWRAAGLAKVRLDQPRVKPVVDACCVGDYDLDVGVVVEVHGQGKDAGYKGLAYCGLTIDRARNCASLPTRCQVVALDTPTGPWVRVVAAPFDSGPRGGGGDGRPFLDCRASEGVTDGEVAKRIAAVLANPPFQQEVAVRTKGDRQTVDGERSYQPSQVLVGYREVVTFNIEVESGDTIARSTVFVSRQNSANLSDYRAMSTSEQAVYRDALRARLRAQAQLDCTDF